MFLKLYSIIIGSLIGTIIILSVIYEYGLTVEDAIRYSLIVLGGICALSLIITVFFTCFVKSFGFDEEPTKANRSFSFPENAGINPVYVLSMENGKQSELSVEIPSVVLNPNYHSKSHN